ncbi:TSUP family transporter [Azospirillum agricola]|uniref:TSUP family transporter n=1 Tax=Azospirillum agricola TaxID=1720247 RepID=UPI000A0F16EC|nr:TSUP family transporter [Azospirillum agricola]SMH61321.1 hypothetical protein SAMN02982994_5762 [Azospirillum lipoferum]
MDQALLIASVISVFALVQSVFGMGLLVFGTPTLLVLGLPFSDALGWLLPASVAISVIQVSGDAKHAQAVWKGGKPLLCIVPLAASLGIVLLFDFHTKIDLAIGLVMIAASAIRVNTALQQRIGRMIDRAERTYLVAMGILHGFTNMGGALLSVYAASINGTKHAVRATVSVYYLFFGMVQIAMLAVLRPEALGYHSLAAAATAAFVYAVAGRLVFHRASAVAYERAVTGFIAVYGVAVLAKASL